MQRKNFLFERTDLNGETPKVLKRWEFSNSPINLLPQLNLSHKHGEKMNVLSFVTPPTETKALVTPKTPMKKKISFKKGDLKPKRLQYSDEETEVASVADSGVHLNSNQSDDSYYWKRTTRYNRSDISQKNALRLRAKTERSNIKTNDKENDRNTIGNRSTNATNSRNNISNANSVVFDPYTEVLSQCEDDIDWKQRLYWLQPRRDVGLWIHCSRKSCQKLRYVEKYHDPTDVPKKWYCKMNPDKSMASCNVKQQYIPHAIKSDLIENIYNAGSIVWAKINGFPWWPGIVNDCPDTFTYYTLKNKSIKPVSYYVTFFNDEKLESIWVPTQKLKAFATNKYSHVIKNTKYKGIQYKDLLKRAYKTATSALSLTIFERLRRYSFVALYDKFYDENGNIKESINQNTDMEVDTDSENEIPCTNPGDHCSLRDYYYLRVLRKNSNTQ